MATRYSPRILASFLKLNDFAAKIGLLPFILFITSFSYAQPTDSITGIDHVTAAVSVTNNGISLLPTFSLGKPAAIFDMSVGGRKLSFEPQFRFALSGRPWSILFWWRYKLMNAEKFSINIGAHPALAFRMAPASINGISSETIMADRYLAGEFSPNYWISRSISVGMYYLYSHGFDINATNNTHFVTLKSDFTSIKLSKTIFIRITPQIYYLKMDEDGGFYVTSTMILSKKNFPLSVSSILNKTIRTDISASKDFVWNVSLIYSTGNMLR